MKELPQRHGDTEVIMMFLNSVTSNLLDRRWRLTLGEKMVRGLSPLKLSLLRNEILRTGYYENQWRTGRDAYPTIGEG